MRVCLYKVKRPDTPKWELSYNKANRQVEILVKIYQFKFGDEVCLNPTE